MKIIPSIAFVLLARLASAQVWPVPVPFTISYGGLATVVVNQQSVFATDANNPAGTYAKPRVTIPADLPAGAIVDLLGDYATPHGSPNRLMLHGTPAAPVAIRSGAAELSRITAFWEITGSSYFVLDRLSFLAGLTFVGPDDHFVVQYSLFPGNGATCAGIGLSPYGTTNRTHDFSFLNNTIVNQGDVHATYDQDCHGIGVGAYVDHGYFYFNEMAYNSGDGIQINGGQNGRANTHHLFVVSNHLHHNKQSGAWTKQATDVVMARNDCHDHRLSNSSLGACLGGQYGPEATWYLDNTIHDNNRGVFLASDGGEVEPDGTRAFIFDNRITNTRAAGPPSDPADPWQSGAAISLQGINSVAGAFRQVGKNQILGADCGICANRGLTYRYDNPMVTVTRPFVGGPFRENGPVTHAATFAAYKQRYQLP